MKFSYLIAVAAIAVAGLVAYSGANAQSVEKSAPDKQSEATQTQAPQPVHSKLTIMPNGFTSFGAAVQGDFLYAIGGHIGKAHVYHNEGFNRQFYRLNLQDRSSWEILPGGVDLQSVALVSDGQRLIRIGGMTALNAPGETHDLSSTKKVKAFDPLTRKWTDLADLPDLRSSHDAVFHAGKIYVVGGWKLAKDPLAEKPEGAVWHDSMLIFDTATPDAGWKSVKQPFEKRALAVASVGDRIYAIGGIGEKGMTQGVHIFDTTKQSWTKGPDAPGFIFGTSAFGMAGRVYTTNFGGQILSHAGDEIEWRVEGHLAIPRFFHRMVKVGDDELAIIGGAAYGGAARSVEWLKPSEKGASVTRVTIPAPGKAKGRQGAFLDKGSLYVFGGNNSVKDHQFKPKNFESEAFKISLPELNATKIADFPVNRQSMVTFMQGTRDRFAEKLGFAIGGFGHDGKDAVTQEGIFLYSVDADVWEPAKIKLPARLTQFGIGEYENKVYIFGGLDFDPKRGKKGRFKESRAIWMYDAKSKSNPKTFVKLEPELPTSRRAFGGAVLDGKFYHVGGMTKDFEEVDQCDVYDFKTGTWSKIPNPSDVRLSPTLVPLDGKLYLVGGSSPTEDGFVRNRSIEEFDPATQTWRTVVADIGQDMSEMKVFAYGHRILIYSVHNVKNEVRLLFVDP